MAKGLRREHEELNSTKPSTFQNQDEKADGRILLRLTVSFGIAVYNLFTPWSSMYSQKLCIKKLMGSINVIIGVFLILNVLYNSSYTDKNGPIPPLCNQRNAAMLVTKPKHGRCLHFSLLDLPVRTIWKWI